MKLILLPGKNPTPEQKSMHTLAFNFWYAQWAEFFKQFHGTFKVSADDFFRQDYVAFLVDGQMPLAVIAHSVFDISELYMRKQSYLSYNFTTSFYEKIASQKINKIITFEALLVNPALRKVANVPVSHLLYGQSIQLVKALADVDAMIAPARNDIGVARLAINGGAQQIEDYQLHGFPVSLLVGRKEDLHLNFLSEFEQKKAIKMFNTEATHRLINANRSNTRDKRKAS
ncbi:MAG: hypothetical protein H7061_14350 [Bdellovibrionaceae bacterium]|nr:hypothetical protein [Bdellovibrio sp.]